MDQRLSSPAEDLSSEVNRLKQCVKIHQSEQSHDRCWLSDLRLYREVLGVESAAADLALPPKPIFLTNCERYWRTHQLPEDRQAPPPHLPINHLGLQIRLMRPSDLASVTTIDQKLWGAWANPLPMYRQFLEMFPSTMLVAEGLNGQINGMAIGFGGEKIVDAWVLSIDVDPQSRGKGLGAAMLAALLRHFDWYGVTQVSAMVDETNIPSQRLFERLGFERSSREAGYFNDSGAQIRYVRRSRSKDAREQFCPFSE